MCGGWSDDGFWDFRSTLITCGREIFELALKEPDSLAALDPEFGTILQVEGLQYIARKVAERLGGDLLDRAQPHPQEPGGKKLDGLAVETFTRSSRRNTHPNQTIAKSGKDHPR